MKHPPVSRAVCAFFCFCLLFVATMRAETYTPGSDGTNGTHGGGSGHNGGDGGNGTSGNLIENGNLTISSPRNVGGSGGSGYRGDAAGAFHSAGRGGYGGNGGSGEATVHSGVDVHFSSNIILGGAGGIGGDGGETILITDSGTGGYGGNGGTGLFNINGTTYINSTLTVVGGTGGVAGAGGFASVKDGGKGGNTSYGGEGTINIATGGYLWSGSNTTVLIGGNGGNAGTGGNGLLLGGDGGDGLRTGGFGLLQVDGDMFIGGKLYVGGSGGNGGNAGDGLAGTGGNGGRGAIGGTGSIGVYSGISQFQNTVEIGGNGGSGGDGGNGITLYGGNGGNGGKGGGGTLYATSNLSFASDVRIGGNGGQGGNGGNSLGELFYWVSHAGTGGAGGDGTFSGKGTLAFSNLTIGGGGGHGGQSGTGVWTGDGGDGGTGGYGFFNFLGGELAVDTLAIGGSGGDGGRSGDAHYVIFRAAISGAGGKGGAGGNGEAVFDGKSIIHGVIFVGGSGGNGGGSGFASSNSADVLEGTTGDEGDGGAGGEGTATIKGFFEGADIHVGGNGGNGATSWHVAPHAGTGGSGGAGGAGTLMIDAQTTKLANVYVGGGGGVGSNTSGDISEGDGGRGGAGGAGVLSIQNGTIDIGGSGNSLIVGGNANSSGTGEGHPWNPTGAGGNGLLEVKGGTTTISSTVVKIGGNGGNVNEAGQQGGNGGNGILTVLGGEITFNHIVQLGGNGGNGKGNIIGGNGSMSITGGTVNFLDTVVLGGEGTSYGTGNVNIGGGSIFLGGTADMRLNGIGSFNVTGGTLATTAKGTTGHEIRANTMSIGNNAVLEFDLSGANATTLNLSLSGFLSGQIGGGIIRVIGVAHAPTAGTLYNLVDTGSANKAVNTGTLYLNSETTVYTPKRTESWWYSLTTNSNASILQLISVANPGGNTAVTWNTGNGIWNIGTENWIGTINGVTIYSYENGDDVRFLSAQPNGITVTVQPGGVTPKSMTVENPGSWTFTGGKLDVAEKLSVVKNATATLNLETRTENLLVDTGATLNVFSNGNVLVGSAIFGANTHLGVAVVDEMQPAVIVDDAAKWSVDATAVLDITGYHLGGKALLFQATNGTFTSDDLFKTVAVAGIEIGRQTGLGFFLNPVAVTLDNGNQDIVAEFGGLVWNNGTAKGLLTGNAHGTFNVRTLFHIREALDDNTSGNGIAFNWDGTTLTKTGQGTLYLDATNTYTGGTFIKDGEVVATNIGALGTGTVHFDGGNLVLDWHNTGTFGNGIEGNGQFTIRSGSDVAISNNNMSFTGETIVESAATLNLRHINAIGSSLLTVYGTANIEDDFDNHFRGDGLIVFGYNGLVIDYANDGFTGTVAVGESMTLGNSRGFGDAQQVDIQGSASLTLDFNGRFNTPIIGSASAGLIVGNNRMMLFDTDNVDYKGTFTIGSGAAVSIMHIDAIGDSQTGNTVTNNGTLHFNFADSGSYARDIEGSGGIIKSGANELTLDGSLTYTGATLVRGGTLVADLPGGTDLSLRNDGTTFQIRNQDLTLDNLNGTGSVVFEGNGKSLTVHSGNFGDGEIRDLDQLTVGAGGNFTVGNVNADNLEVRAGAKLAIAPDSRILLDSGASFGAGSTLGVAITDTSIPIVQIGDTSQWSVDSTATLDIQGYRLQPAILFETTSTDFAAGDVFQKITVAGYEISGTLTENRFIDLLAVTINTANAKQIIAKSGPLIWYNGVTPGTENYDAHGTFNIGTNFRIDEQLNDNTSGRGAAFNWDGKTLTKTGSGILVLGAENTYTGGTLIEAGRVVMTNANAIGTGEVDISALAALDVTYAGVLSNSFKGTGTLNLWDDLTIASNNPNFSEFVNVKNGTTTATRLYSLGNNVTTTLEDGTTLVYNINENGTVANNVRGDGTFIKTGTGNMTVTGMQSYTGATNIDAGSLAMNLPTAADLYINKNAAYENINAPNIVLTQLNGAGRFDAKDANVTVSSGNFSNGTLSNIGEFTKNSTDTLVIDGTQNIGGNFTLADGTLILTGTPSLTIAGSATFGRGTTLSFSVADLADGATVIRANDAQIGRNTTLDITGYNGETELVLLQTQTGNMFILDFAEYRINGVPITSNRVTFETFLMPGGIQKTLNAIVLKKTHLVWDNTEDFSAHGTFFIGDGSVNINRDLVDNPHSNAYMYNPADQEWWDGKTLTKTGGGTLVLNGQNTFTGDVHVQEGTLVGTHVNSFGDPSSTGKFILEGSSTLQFGDYNVHVTKTIEGHGRLLKTGNSAFTFSGNADNAQGIFQQDGGTVNLHSDWGGYYLMTSGLFATNGDRSITEGSLFANGVIDHEGTLSIGKRLAMEDVIVKAKIGANEQTGTFNNKIVADEVFLHNAELDIDLSDLSLRYFRSQRTLSWTILESANGIHGDFSNMEEFVANRLFTVDYGVRGNNWILEFTIVDAPFYGFNYNTDQAAKYLNQAQDEEGPQMTPLLFLIGSFVNDDDYRRAIDGLRGSELHADARKLALWQPWRHAYKRLYDSHTCTKQSCDIWVEGYVQDTNVHSDGNAVRYNNKRDGITTGYDTRLNSWSKLGFFFGYGNPRLTNRLGHVEADDYTFALTSKIQMNGDWHALGFLGYGHQNYKTTRYDFLDRHDAKYNGDTIYASLQFYRPMTWRRGITLYPLLALDYQNAWTNKTVESGLYGQSIARGNLEEFALRFGLDTRFRQSDRMDVRTRLQYRVLVGGDRYTSAQSRFTASSLSETINLRSVDSGRNGLNMGIGGNWHLDSRKRSHLFADYDFDLGERSTAHTGQFGFMTHW